MDESGQQENALVGPTDIALSEVSSANCVLNKESSEKMPCWRAERVSVMSMAESRLTKKSRKRHSFSSKIIDASQ